jgi:FkbM family methyltransferase
MSDEFISGLAQSPIGTVATPAGLVRYLARGSALRYESLLTKEPETIEWIDSFLPGDIFWDVGANVGLYSVYAAMRGAKVTAFEPHFGNYFQCCLNVLLNNLQGSVTALCLAVADKKIVGTLNVANLDFGSALSSFGNDLDYRGNPYNVVLRQGMVGYSLDELVADFQLPIPNHIKVDVDGIELDIARGARRLLSNEQVRSISIELVDTNATQVDGVSKIIVESGLRFVHKKQNPIYNDTPTGDVLNFLFRRQ